MYVYSIDDHDHSQPLLAVQGKQRHIGTWRWQELVYFCKGAGCLHACNCVMGTRVTTVMALRNGCNRGANYARDRTCLLTTSNAFRRLIVPVSAYSSIPTDCMSAWRVLQGASVMRSKLQKLTMQQPTTCMATVPSPTSALKAAGPAT